MPYKTLLGCVRPADEWLILVWSSREVNKRTGPSFVCQTRIGACKLYEAKIFTRHSGVVPAKELLPSPFVLAPNHMRRDWRNWAGSKLGVDIAEPRSALLVMPRAVATDLQGKHLSLSFFSPYKNNLCVLYLL
jgi:hypothetical protein